MMSEKKIEELRNEHLHLCAYTLSEMLERNYSPQHGPQIDLATFAKAVYHAGIARACQKILF